MVKPLHNSLDGLAHAALRIPLHTSGTLPTPVKRGSSFDASIGSPKTYLFNVAYPSIKWSLFSMSILFVTLSVFYLQALLNTETSTIFKLALYKCNIIIIVMKYRNIVNNFNNVFDKYISKNKLHTERDDWHNFSPTVILDISLDTYIASYDVAMSTHSFHYLLCPINVLHPC